MGTVKSDGEVAYDSVYFNDSMTDMEKSALLVKAIGTDQILLHAMSYTWHDCNDADTLEIDLYDIANMGAAWRVLNWALEQTEYRQEWIGYMGDALYMSFGDWEVFLVLPPVDAIRMWLDKILELCIEARIIEVE